MFMIGCAGDADPYPHGSLELAREHGTTLGQGSLPGAGDASSSRCAGRSTVAFDRVALPLQEPPARAELEKLAAAKRGISAWVAGQMLAVLARGEKLPTQYTCPLAVWQFGNDLTLVALSGRGGGRLRPADGESARAQSPVDCRRIATTCSATCPRPACSPKAATKRRGLYAGGIGYFSPKAQEVVVEKVRELARKAGRSNDP